MKEIFRKLPGLVGLLRAAATQENVCQGDKSRGLQAATYLTRRHEGNTQMHKYTQEGSVRGST